jgi:hypothetical protein
MSFESNNSTPPEFNALQKTPSFESNNSTPPE